MGRTHRREMGGCQDLHILTPTEEVPAHLERPAGSEPHDQRSVSLFFGLLIRMKTEVRRIGSCFRGEPPDNVKGVFLEYSKRLLGKLLQRKLGITLKIFVQDFDALDVGQAEKPEAFGATNRVESHEIVSVPV